MRTYLKCQRLHQYTYEDGYTPAKQAEALRFGNLWHAVLENVLRFARSSRAAGKQSIFGTIVDMRVVARETIEQSDADPYEAAKLRVLAGEWITNVQRSDFLSRYEIVHVEKFFAFPHMNPDTGRPSQTWVRAGVIDAILREYTTGRVLVMEHKSTSEDIAPDATYWARLLIDTQASQYVLGAEAYMNEDDPPIDTIIYDVTRKPLQRPAKKTENPKYKKRTKAQVEAGLAEDDPSLLYAKMRLEDETPEEYEERLQGVVGDQHVAFRFVSRTDEMVMEHMRNAWAIGKKIHIDIREGFAPKNDNACHQYGTCPFWGVCSGSASLQDEALFTRRSWPHPELPTHTEWSPAFRNLYPAPKIK
jgi:hypothetical protein